MQRTRPRLFVALMAIASIFPFPVSASADGPLVAKTLDRDADAVIVTGARMPGFAGAPLNQLFVYAFRGSQWRQIPWQFDEVRNGEYIAADNGCSTQWTNWWSWDRIAATGPRPTTGSAMAAPVATRATKSRSWTR